MCAEKTRRITSKKGKPIAVAADIHWEDVETCSEDDSSFLNNPKRRPPLPPSKLKKSKKVLEALTKLDLLRQEQDLQNFFFNSKQTPSLYSDTCHISASAEEEDSKKNTSERRHNKKGTAASAAPNIQQDPYGPFLSCHAFHGHGLDFTSFPGVCKPPEKKIIPVNPYGRPNSAPSRSVSGQSSVNRCRKCLKFNVFWDGDQVYEEYKSKVTYSKSKIFKRYGEKISDFEAFELRGDKMKPISGEERGSTMVQGIGQTYEKAGFSPMVRKTSTSNDQNEVMLYGPAAIASVSGYGFKRSTPRPPVLKPKTKTKKADVHKESTSLDEILGFEIPQATDNVRYYDDDTDPMITEILANTAFKLKTESNQSSIKKEASHGIITATQVSNSKSTKPKSIDIIEPTIGSGRKIEGKPVLQSTTKSSLGKITTSITNPVSSSESTTEKSQPIFPVPKNEVLVTKSVKVIKKTGTNLLGDGETYTIEAKEISKTESTKEKIKRSSGLKTTPRSIRVSPKPLKATPLPRINKKGTITSKATTKKKSKSGKQGPKFRRSISTVSLPEPTSKYKITL